MANLVQELLIKIGLKADTAEAVNASKAIGDVAAKSKQAGSGMGEVSKNSKELAGALGKNVEIGGQAVSMMTQLEGASKGGAAGLASAARAGLAFGQMVKGALAGAGPIGIAVTAITLLGAAAFALTKSFAAPKESIDQFKERLAGLDKASLQALDATILALSDRLKAAKLDADAVRQSLDMIDDAEMGAKLAANKASGLKPEEQAKQELLIRDEFKQRRQAREKQAAEEVRDAANEKKKAIAPEYSDARDKYSDLLKESDRIKSEDAELARLQDQRQRRMRGESGMMLSPAENEQAKIEQARIEELERNRPTKGYRSQIDTELASARKTFEGDDGNGGLAKEYNAAAIEADNAEKALRRLLKTREEVAAWEKAQIRIENGGIDPRDAEIAARKSPGKARIVGPDGTVKEYDVAAPQTANQGIGKAADAARTGIPLSTGSGGMMIGPDGKPVAVKPTDPGAPGRGAYREEGKLADQTKDLNATMKEAGEKAGEKVDLQPAVDGAKAVQEGNEQLRTALTDATSAQAEAMQAARDSLNEASATLGDHAGAIRAIKSDLASLKAQMRAAKTK